MFLYNTYIDIELSENKKQILTIFPNNWFAFQGLNEKLSLLTNISNIPHDDNEVENTNLETFDYNWEIM